ncbi:MAG: ABC transporter permease [Gemmatimonadaceae bacterium]
MGEVVLPDAEDRASVRRAAYPFAAQGAVGRIALRWATAEGVLGGVILLVFAVLALFPGVFSSVDGLQSGGPAFASPQALYPLGTDLLGRDSWARLVFGARTSLAVGVLATLIALTVCVLIGTLAALLGGWWDDLLMRTAEIADSIPALLLALLLVSVVGPGLVPVALVVGLTGWLGVARVVRAELLLARDLPFALAARALGARRTRVALTHLAPEVLIPVLALIPFRLEGAIVVEAGLSFLGVEDARRPSWGAMLRDAQSMLLDAWWLAAAPVVSLALLLFALGLVADYLQQTFDPRMR